MLGNPCILLLKIWLKTENCLLLWLIVVRLLILLLKLAFAGITYFYKMALLNWGFHSAIVFELLFKQKYYHEFCLLSLGFLKI